MSALLSALSIDPIQWKALVRASLRNDLRAPGRAFDVSGRARNANAAIGTLLQSLSIEPDLLEVPPGH